MTSEALALALLAATLAFAMVRPRGLPEAVVAVPAAALVVVAGGLTPREALQEVRDLAPTVVFTAVARLRLRPKPHVYACTHLTNSASLLLPVSTSPTCWPSGPAGCRSPASGP